MSCGVNRKTSPAATDLKYPVARLNSGNLGDAGIFCFLCLSERGLRLGEQSRRIGHCAVEPGGIKIVTEIVVSGNIAPAAGDGVGLQAVTQAAQHGQRKTLH